MFVANLTRVVSALLTDTDEPAGVRPDFSGFGAHDGDHMKGLTTGIAGWVSVFGKIRLFRLRSTPLLQRVGPTSRPFTSLSKTTLRSVTSRNREFEIVFSELLPLTETLVTTIHWRWGPIGDE